MEVRYDGSLDAFMVTGDGATFTFKKPSNGRKVYSCDISSLLRRNKLVFDIEPVSENERL